MRVWGASVVVHSHRVCKPPRGRIIALVQWAERAAARRRVSSLCFAHRPINAAAAIDCGIAVDPVSRALLPKQLRSLPGRRNHLNLSHHLLGTNSSQRGRTCLDFYSSSRSVAMSQPESVATGGGAKNARRYYRTMTFGPFTKNGQIRPAPLTFHPKPVHPPVRLKSTLGPTMM